MKYNSISDPTDFNFSMKMAAMPPRPPMALEAKNLIANAGYDGKSRMTMYNYYLNLLYNTNGRKATMYMQPYLKDIVPAVITYKCSRI